MSPREVEDRLPQFECTKCGACCREDSMLITVTGRDIVRISTALGLSPEETMRALDFYIVDDPNTIPVGLQGIPSPSTERGSAFIALRKMENGECIFLKDNLCMIHTLRPIVCRSFPFVFQEKGSQRKWGLSAVKQICPGLGTGPKVSEKDIEELSALVLESIKTYHEFVDEWNSLPTTTARELIRTILSDPRFFA
ncbi:MAG: YkgJ family cysteine cluster protein [Candidatus Odinarchaeota archaeon]